MPTVPKLASWGDAEAASYSFSTRPAGAEACSRADELVVDADGTGTWVRMRPGAQPAGAAVVQARRRMQQWSRATRNRRPDDEDSWHASILFSFLTK